MVLSPYAPEAHQGTAEGAIKVGTVGIYGRIIVIGAPKKGKTSATMSIVPGCTTLLGAWL